MMPTKDYRAVVEKPSKQHCNNSEVCDFVEHIIGAAIFRNDA